MINSTQTFYIDLNHAVKIGVNHFCSIAELDVATAVVANATNFFSLVTNIPCFH